MLRKSSQRISKLSPAREAALQSNHFLVPRDRDTRSELVQIIDSPQPDIEPVWPEIHLETLNRILSEWAASDKLAKHGFHPIKSVLIYGAPGVGKTLTATWLAQKLGMPLIRLDLATVMSSLLGRTGVNIRKVLDFAKNIQCVLLLDEFDSIAKKRDDDTEIGELKRLVNVLLQEIEQWPETSLLIAATNHPQLLDPAAWRRFELVAELPLPGVDGCEKLIRNLLPESIDGSLIKTLALLYSKKAPSEVVKHIRQARKTAIINDWVRDDLAKELLLWPDNNLTKSQKIARGVKLVQQGMSQVQAAKISGVDRKTIVAHFSKKAKE